MRYLVDGHNLIHKLSDISITDPKDEELLVEKLKRFAKHSGQRFVVVFDKGKVEGKSSLSSRAVEVHFAASDSNADTKIIGWINQCRDRNEWTVVSSDKEIIQAAKFKGIQVIKSEEFAKKLNPKRKSTSDDEKPSHMFPSDMDELRRIFGSEN